MPEALRQTSSSANGIKYKDARQKPKEPRESYVHGQTGAGTGSRAGQVQRRMVRSIRSIQRDGLGRREGTEALVVNRKEVGGQKDGRAIHFYKKFSK